MAITSITVGALELMNGTYQVANQTHYALVAKATESPRLVEMAGRYPVYGGTTPQVRQIPLLIMLLSTTVSQRMADYDALMAQLSNDYGLVPLTWVDGTTTRRFWVHVDSAVPDRWFSRVAVGLTAPNPNAEVV